MRSRFALEKSLWIDPCISALFGQGITSIRSAWDHLAWQLVLLDGGQPNRFTQFPLHDSEFTDTGARRSLKIEPGIRRDDIKEAIAEVQPYKSGPPWSPGGQMGVVNELARIDKHRLLVAIATMLDIDSVFWGLPEGHTTPKCWFPVGRPTADGDAAARFVFDAPVAPEEFDPHLAPHVALAEGPPGNMYRQQAIDSLLKDLAAIAAMDIDMHLVPLFPDEAPIWLEPGQLRR